MSEKLLQFPIPSLEEWRQQFEKELKGQDPDVLKNHDEIEEFDYSCYQHPDSLVNETQKISDLPDFKTFSKENNDWLNCGTIFLKNEVSIEKANLEALDLLNLGADSIRFILSNETIDFDKLFATIELQYIHTYIVIQTFEQFQSLQKQLNKELQQHVSIEFDGIGNEELSKKINETIDTTELSLLPTLTVNAFNIQQAGATTWQEVAFSLSSGHYYLHLLLSTGKSTEEANDLIQFNIGIGSNYFYETAKIMVIKALWNKLLSSYNPNHIAKETKILAVSGFMNKSLKDPYTNLLRQTTEIMSAVSGGVQCICNQPYNLLALNSKNQLSKRMALNISAILKEESYFDAVQNPQIGSYTNKLLCDLISKKAWTYFQELEELGGIIENECIKKLQKEVQLKAKMRIERLNENEDLFIGINIFQNMKEEVTEWKKQDSYLGMQPIVLEQHLNQEN